MILELNKKYKCIWCKLNVMCLLHDTNLRLPIQIIIKEEK